MILLPQATMRVRRTLLNLAGGCKHVPENTTAIILCHVFIFLYIITDLSACRKPDQGTQNPIAQRSTPQIEKLIASGKKFESIEKDSLPLITKKLYHIYQFSGDKTALIYSELFESEYYWHSAEYEAGMQQALKSLNDAEKWKITRAVSEIYDVMGNLHKESGNYKLGIEDANNAIAAAKLNKDTSQIIADLGLKASFVHGLSIEKRELPSQDSSTRLQFEALKMAESKPDYEQLRIRFYDNIAQHYLEAGKYDSTIFYVNKGIRLALKYSQQRSLTYSYTWLGESLYFKGRKNTGLYYLDKALQIAKAIRQPFRVMEIYECYNKCYLSSGDYKLASRYFNIARAVRDSIQLLSNEKQIGELQIKYETAKKDEEIVILNNEEHRKNIQLEWTLACAAVFAIFMVILFFQFRVIRHRNHLIKASNDRLNKSLNDIAYIQSHHLRKPVANILGLINVIKSDDYKAKKDCLHKMEEAALELDEKIHAINTHTQINL